ncbi:hypothetical protein [Candidatus Poriferisodalis sp.]|uniref:hypothetical protein n=1 Tax=Candidatus Poriferisodalis sp. TaxID=3101277 RepID=UPI003C6EBA37
MNTDGGAYRVVFFCVECGKPATEVRTGTEGEMLLGLRCDSCNHQASGDPVAELLARAHREAAYSLKDGTELGWGDFPFRARIVVAAS